jgi:FkbM family methyltransferase
MSLSSLVRGAAGRFGYRIEKTRFQRYGIDPIVDVLRLSGKFGVPIDRAFDVGANVGQTAAALTEAFPQADILCFEPVAATYRQLQTAAALMPRVRAFNIALSDSAGEAVMHTYDSSLLSSLEPNALFTEGRAATTETCRKETLDAFCAEQGIERIGLLKIDTEGHDLSVLRGAAAMLAQGRIGFVLTEFNRLDGEGGETIGSLNAIAGLLRTYGYTFICSYIDDIIQRERPFVVGNALFVRAEGAGSIEGRPSLG